MVTITTRNRRSMLRLFKKKKNTMEIAVDSPTVPGAFGISESNFGLLVDDLVNTISPENRLASLDAYLKSPMFAQRHLDLSNPKHSLIIGYAFSTAVLMQRELQQRIAANKALEIFYPEVKGSKTLHG